MKKRQLVKNTGIALAFLAGCSSESPNTSSNTDGNNSTQSSNGGRETECPDATYDGVAGTQFDTGTTSLLIEDIESAPYLETSYDKSSFDDSDQTPNIRGASVLAFNLAVTATGDTQTVIAGQNNVRLLYDGVALPRLGEIVPDYFRVADTVYQPMEKIAGPGVDTYPGETRSGGIAFVVPDSIELPDTLAMVTPEEIPEDSDPEYGISLADGGAEQPCLFTRPDADELSFGQMVSLNGLEASVGKPEGFLEPETVQNAGLMSTTADEGAQFLFIPITLEVTSKGPRKIPEPSFTYSGSSIYPLSNDGSGEYILDGEAYTMFGYNPNSEGSLLYSDLIFPGSETTGYVGVQLPENYTLDKLGVNLELGQNNVIFSTT